MTSGSEGLPSNSTTKIDVLESKESDKSFHRTTEICPKNLFSVSNVSIYDIDFIYNLSFH